MSQEQELDTINQDKPATVVDKVNHDVDEMDKSLPNKNNTLDKADSDKGDSDKGDTDTKLEEEPSKADELTQEPNEIMNNDGLVDELTGETIADMVGEIDEETMMKGLKEECRELSVALGIPANQLKASIEACVVLTLEEEAEDDIDTGNAIEEEIQ